MISLSVKTLEGQTRSFELADETTVRQFKDVIHTEMNIPVSQIRLIFQGKVLQEAQKLSEIGVDGKVVHLVRREPPWNNRPQGSSSQASRNAPGSGSTTQGSTSQSGGRDSGPSLEEQLDAEMLRSMIHDILSGMGDVARMATVVTEPSDEGGFDIEVNIPSGVQRRSLARMRQRYVGAIESQARAVARWLEDPAQFTSPQPDYVVLRRSERSVDPTLDDSDAGDAGGGAASTAAPAAPATSTEGSSSQEATRTGSTATATSVESDGHQPERAQGGEESDGDDSDPPSLNPVAASELANMVDSVEALWRDVRPLIDRWQTLLREDPSVGEDEATTRERQRLHDGVSRLLHLQSHMLHNMSDFIVEFHSPPPRRLLVMAESPMQSMSARINIDAEQFATSPLHRSRPPGNANNTSARSSPSSASPSVGATMRSGSRGSTPSSTSSPSQQQQASQPSSQPQPSSQQSTQSQQQQRPRSGQPGQRSGGPGGPGVQPGLAGSRASPFLRFVLPAMGLGAGSFEGMGVVTSGPGVVTGHPGIRTQRGQTADGTPYVWASAGPHIDYEMRPDMFSVNSTWTHVITDTEGHTTSTTGSTQSGSSSANSSGGPGGQQSRSQPPQAPPPPPPPPQQQQQRGQGGQQQGGRQQQQQRPGTFQREMYTRVLEQALRQSLQATAMRAAIDPEHGHFGAQNEHILGGAVLGGSTWNTVDPYLPCNSRHFVDFISTSSDAGGRRFYTTGPVHQLVLDPRVGIIPPRMSQSQGQSGSSTGRGSQGRSGQNGQGGSAAPVDGANLLSELLTQRLGLNMGAIEGLLTEMQGAFPTNLLHNFNLPPLGSNIIFDSFLVSAEVLDVGDLLRAGLTDDHSVLDRLRTPLRDLFRRRLETRHRSTPGSSGSHSTTETVHAMVDDGLKDRVFLEHPIVSGVNNAFREWLAERNGLPPRRSADPPIDWIATVRRLSVAYTSDLILLTMDSPTDVGYGQLLFDEELTSYRQLYALIRTHTNAADMVSLLQRIVSCFVDNPTTPPVQMAIQTFASFIHGPLESYHQSMSESARQALCNRWLVHAPSKASENNIATVITGTSNTLAHASATDDTAMDIDDDQEEEFSTPPEREVEAQSRHSPSDRPVPPEHPLERHPRAEPVPASAIEALSSEWREIVPPDWLNVIAHDCPRPMSPPGAIGGTSGTEDGHENGVSVDSERTGVTVRPLSEAYVSGMPAKRRRLMMAARSSRPSGTPREMFQQVMRDAFEDSRLGNGTAENLASEASVGPSLERAFIDYTNERVGELLDSNPDYERHRYPESEKLFRGGGAKRHPSNTKE